MNEVDHTTGSHTATRCNTLQHMTSVIVQSTITHCNTRYHTTWITHCNTLQHAATHCNTLQHTVTHCNTLVSMTGVTHSATQCIKQLGSHTATHSKSQHAATHLNTLQHTASRHMGHTLQQTATHITDCNRLQQTATDCNRLQKTATHSITPEGDEACSYIYLYV